MYPVSQTLQTAINNGTPQRVLLEFTDANVSFSNEDIVVSTGVELNEMFNSETDLTIGLCPSAEIRFDMLNDNGQLEEFEFGKFKAWLGARIDSGTPSSTAKTKTFAGTAYDGLYEFTPLGVFIADRPAVVKKKILTITANDQMQLFDVDMPSAEELSAATGFVYSSTSTISALATALCTYVGVTLKSTGFINNGIVISSPPESFENATIREVLGWIAEAACSIARFDRDGELEFVLFSTTAAVFDEHNYSEFTPAWYETKAIDKLHIRNADSTSEYTFGQGENAYMIQDNPFLRQGDTDYTITITGQPQSRNEPLNSVIIFTVEANNATAFQWQQSTDNGATWANVDATQYMGSTSRTMSFALTTEKAARLYRCVVSNEVIRLTTNSVSATPNYAITIVQQPANVTRNLSETAVLSVDAVNVTAYQWQYSEDGSTWSNVGTTTYEGGTTNMLRFVVSQTTAGRSYRCALSNAGGAQSATNTSIATVTINTQVSIDVQPQSVVASENDIVIFSVVATNATSYQWQQSEDAGETWTNVDAAEYSGGTTNTVDFTLTTARSSKLYRCIASNAQDSKATNVVAAAIGYTIVITRQPQSVTGDVDDVVSFTVIAANVSAYQWQKSADNGATWADITDAAFVGRASDKMSFALTAESAANQYRCTLSNGNNTINTNAVTATINV